MDCNGIKLTIVCWYAENTCISKTYFKFAFEFLKMKFWKVLPMEIRS